MKIWIDVQDINNFKDVSLALDLDEEHNCIGFSFVRTDKDGKLRVIKSDSFKVYEEDN